MNYLNNFLFGIFPYICLTIFLVGNIARFEGNQYSWKSESSQIIYTGTLRLGNNLFHIGIIGIFFGHLLGLLTPLAFWEFLGVSHGAKQIFAILAGGIMGGMTLIGLILLIIRRLSNDRLRQYTTFKDALVLVWFLVTLIVGLSTIFVSIHHLDGEEMVQLMNWAQRIVTFRGGAAQLISKTSIIFKIHIFLGMTLFAIFPFTRLVHIWSGFASIFYITRKWQIVRTKKIHNYNK